MTAFKKVKAPVLDWCHPTAWQEMSIWLVSLTEKHSQLEVCKYAASKYSFWIFGKTVIMQATIHI